MTLGAPKIPLILPPADTHSGDLVIADIGIPFPILDDVEGPYIELLTRERMRELVPARAADSHKGDFGRVLVIAGSVGRSGAAHLAAIGALRSGAGLVTVATPRSCLPIVAAMAPEYMTEGLEETAAGTIDFAALDRVLDFKADVIAVGPGLGQSPGTAAFVHGLLERAGVPLILDADALNAFSRRSGASRRPRWCRRRDHAASGRDGAAAQSQYRSGAARSAASRDRVCGLTSRARRAQGASNDHCRARQPRLHQSHRATPGWPLAGPAIC